MEVFFLFLLLLNIFCIVFQFLIIPIFFTHTKLKKIKLQVEEEKKDVLTGAAKYRQLAMQHRKEQPDFQSAAQMRDQMIRTNEETI